VKVRAAACGFGVAFGFLISWGQFTDPDRIRQMLLLEDAYLYLMMFMAIAIAFLGARILRRRHARAILTGELVRQESQRPEPRHLAGAAIFAIGWAVADSCPAPIAAQLSQGVLWSLFTIAGVFLGILGYFRWQERRARAAIAESPARA
jgi:uncharacterized membrane protein YedE/YeeE